MTALVTSKSVAVEAQPGFDEFFARFARQVAAIVALSTGDPDLAEDATQEAMARAHADWHRISALKRPDLWVTRVAANQAIDTWRKRRREVRLHDTSPAEPRDEIRVLWIRWALERLTPEDRLLIILRHRDGMSIDEIGRSLGKAPNTITSYLKRARRRLRSVLSEGDG